MMVSVRYMLSKSFMERVKIPTRGKRDLGAAIGDESFIADFLSQKVEKWCFLICSLAEIAQTQPHAAYTAYLPHGSHRRPLCSKMQPLCSQMQPLSSHVQRHGKPYGASEQQYAPPRAPKVASEQPYGPHGKPNGVSEQPHAAPRAPKSIL